MGKVCSLKQTKSGSHSRPPASQENGVFEAQNAIRIMRTVLERRISHVTRHPTFTPLQWSFEAFIVWPWEDNVAILLRYSTFPFKGLPLRWFTVHLSEIFNKQSQVRMAVLGHPTSAGWGKYAPGVVKRYEEFNTSDECYKSDDIYSQSSQMFPHGIRTTIGKPWTPPMSRRLWSMYLEDHLHIQIPICDQVEVK